LKEGIGPENPSLIEVFREAPFGDSDGTVAGAGEDAKASAAANGEY
jgi:hypothetical protein